MGQDASHLLRREIFAATVPMLDPQRDAGKKNASYISVITKESYRFNVYVYGVRPLFDIGAYLQPELYWDVGLVRLTKGIQEQANNLANLRMQNVMMQINQMLRVDPNWNGDANDLVWRPFGLVEAAQGEIEPIVIPDYHSTMFQEQEMFFKETIQDLMGMYDYNMGVTPQRQERVGVVYGIQSMGEARAKLMLMTADYQGIRPLLRYLKLDIFSPS